MVQKIAFEENWNQILMRKQEYLDAFSRDGKKKVESLLIQG
jgi:hypothetical protein